MQLGGECAEATKGGCDSVQLNLQDRPRQVYG
jgi:hypothetical protein